MGLIISVIFLAYLILGLVGARRLWEEKSREDPIWSYQMRILRGKFLLFLIVTIIICPYTWLLVRQLKE